MKQKNKTIVGNIRDSVSHNFIGIRLSNLIALIDLALMHIHKDKQTIKIIKKEILNRTTYPNELFNLYFLAKRQRGIKGDYAEVGVFRGSSARIISENKGNKTFHLFDTFEGLPKPTKRDKYYKEGKLKIDFAKLKKSLKKYSNLRYHKGIFPESAKGLENKRFSFVNLDCDLYKSTLDCLEFFYIRMNKGGIIICHDYQSVLPVKIAVDKFLSDKKEKLFELYMSQCMIIKE